MHDDSIPHRRGRALALLSMATLLLHAVAMSGLAWAWASPDVAPQPATASAVQVRFVVDEIAPALLPLPVAQSMPVAQSTATAPVPARPHRAATRQQQRQQNQSQSQPQPQPQSQSQPQKPAAAVVAEVVPATVTEPPLPWGAIEAAKPNEAVLAMNSVDLAEASGTLQEASDTDTAAAAIPHYRTRLPPAVTLEYDLQRGFLHGNGELAWRPERDHYELKLTGRVGGLAALTQISTGGFDAAGVAPLRFTDQRLSRAPMAANFQRDAGKITFSGPSTEYPLVAGAQDRLSWMIQLAAIVSAEPALRVPNAAISMFVVGSRGEGDVWVFRCLGPERIDMPGGSVAALKYMRVPRDEHDTQVQVWLDPGRHWLPVRARQQSGRGDDAFELRLQSASPP